jgi:hypothetical protein
VWFEGIVRNAFSGRIGHHFDRLFIEHTQPVNEKTY